jgi:hypothetical protein
VTEYSVLVKHSGFVDRFLKSDTPPENIGMSIWWAIEDSEIIRFRRRESADNCKRRYELHFAAKGEKIYSFVVVKVVMQPKWIQVDEYERIEG